MATEKDHTLPLFNEGCRLFWIVACGDILNIFLPGKSGVFQAGDHQILHCLARDRVDLLIA